MAPVIVYSPVLSDATTYAPQKKIFWANGYWWLWFSDGTNICYCSSTDGINWGAKQNTGLPATDGYLFEVRYFPNYSTSYCYIGYIASARPYFVRCTIGAGTVTVGTAYPAAPTALCQGITVGIRTDGVAYVGINRQDGTYSNRFWLFTCAVNDGSGFWSTVWYSDIHGVGASYYMVGSIQQLTATKMVVIYGSTHAGTLYSNYFNGSAWGGETNPTMSTLLSTYFAATAWADNVLVEYYAGLTNPLKAILFTASGGWGSEETPQTDHNDGTFYPADIACDGSGNCWLGFYGAKTIYVIKRSSAAAYSGETLVETSSFALNQPVFTEGLVSGYFGLGWVDLLTPSLYFDRYNTAPAAAVSKGDGYTWIGV